MKKTAKKETKVAKYEAAELVIPCPPVGNTEVMRGKEPLL